MEFFEILKNPLNNNWQIFGRYVELGHISYAGSKSLMKEIKARLEELATRDYIKYSPKVTLRKKSS